MHTHTYATAIKEKEVMNFKESKMGYMEGSRQRKGKEDIMEFYYNFKKNELIRKHKKTLASKSNHEKKKRHWWECHHTYCVSSCTVEPQ